MNTLEIDSILYSDKYCDRVFKGTHAIDALPQFEPGCYVVNLAPSNHPGIHWVAVFSLTGRDDVEYFDSAGQPAPSQLVQWWQSSFIQNPCPLQDANTDVCGQYIIWHTGVGDVAWETFCPRSPLTLTTMIWLFTTLLTVTFVFCSKKMRAVSQSAFIPRLWTWSIW